MIAKWVILPLLLGTALSAPGAGRPSNHRHRGNPDHEPDEEPIDPSGVEPHVSLAAGISHATADETTDSGESDERRYVTPRENAGRAVEIQREINPAHFRHRIVPNVGKKHTKSADLKEFRYDEEQEDAKHEKRVHPVGTNAATEDKVYSVGVKQKNAKTDEEFQAYDDSAVPWKANGKSVAGDRNLEISQLALIKNKIIHLDAARNVHNADPKSNDDYEGEIGDSSERNENQGSSLPSAMKNKFKVTQHTGFADSTNEFKVTQHTGFADSTNEFKVTQHTGFADSPSEGQREVNEPTEPSSTPAFEAFYPREAYGIPNSAARAPHGHATFYKYRNPALVDTNNAAAYGFRFDGKRRFNYD